MLLLRRRREGGGGVCLDAFFFPLVRGILGEGVRWGDGEMGIFDFVLFCGVFWL